MSRFLDALRSGRVLLMDGAMGTELRRAGLPPGGCGELWNLTHPERVRAIHRAYADAGAEVLLTNTFLADPVSLARFGESGRSGEICRAALGILRGVAGPERFVLADVGPSPFLTDAASLPSYLADFSGAGAVLVETCSDTATALAAVGALARAGHLERTGVVASFTYRGDRPGIARTVGGETAADLARQLDRASGVLAIGVNCGRELGMPHLAEIVRAYRENTSLPVFVRPNAGTPRETEGRLEYPRSPEEMASWLPELLEAGVSMVGGCCGTTPAYVAAFKRVVDAWNAR
jgi:5-methyltetrahydrofolate--homocysteine methyltransferase